MNANGAAAWHRVGDILLLVHGSRTATDAEWSEWIDSPEAQDVRGVIVRAHSGRPTPLQREQIQDRFGRVHSAILTDSVVARGVVTALSWFGVPARAFLPDDVEAAMSFAGLELGEVAQVRRLLAEMSARVGVV